MSAQAINLARRFRPAAAVAFAALAIVFAIVNFSVAPLMGIIGPNDWTAILVYISFGLIAAEGGLIAIWGVLGAGNRLVRFAACAVIGVWLYLYWAAGYVMPVVWQQSYYRLDRCFKEIWMGLLCLPAAYFAAQLPLWIVRLGFAWRIERMDPATLAIHRPLTIRYLMLATGLVGVALGGSRLGSRFFFDGRESDFWIGFGIMTAMIAGTSLVSTLPTVAAVLRTRRPAVGTAAILIYSIAAVVVTYVVIAWLTSQRFRPWELFAMILVSTSLATGLSGPLLIARRFGYRLSWGKLKSVTTLHDLQETKNAAE